MKKKTLFASCALLALAVPFAAQAAGCGKPRSAFDQVYCTSTQFSQSDRDLNDEYGRLRKQLSGDQQATLKAGQLAWLKQRDARCSETRNNSYLVDIQCANDMTQSRLSFLRERERECSSTGCVASKLGE
ncbi:lysozyme inhibitor LprI family protein [Burkholderia arboris]|uniref:lysozyme inhibitor LprI family protein n=1 Tax=Burkholderia arboris TaxID=488730 RepID=UPI00210DDBB4|nr:lysozyme inhibitor LprI family protein [Burkholderia arboris]UTV56735.1 lysozyme inhibitor LprI family protein [Burkholderia arboris]